jgi:hypothetical protein
MEVPIMWPIIPGPLPDLLEGEFCCAAAELLVPRFKIDKGAVNINNTVKVVAKTSRVVFFNVVPPLIKQNNRYSD